EYVKERKEGDGEKRRGDQVGKGGGVAHQPAVADAHPADREARQRADGERQEHRRPADKEAVAELAPEIFKIPVALGDDDPEALEGRLRRPDIVGEHVAVRLERHRHHVVDRRERPDHEHDAENKRRRLGQVSPQPVVGATADRTAIHRRRTHSVTSVVCSLRISRITSGIIKGSADITTATPSSGLAISKALRIPSVASTWVDKAGPPPETK